MVNNYEQATVKQTCDILYKELKRMPPICSVLGELRPDSPTYPQDFTIFPIQLNNVYKNRSIGPELTTSKTGPIHLSSLVEIAFVDWFTKLLLINVSIYMNI